MTNNVVFFSGKLHIQGVQQNCLHLVSSIFLEQIKSNLNKSGEFWKLEKILYTLNDRHQNFYNRSSNSWEIWILKWQCSFVVNNILILIFLFQEGLPTIDSIISVISLSIFKILVPILPKHHKLFEFWWFWRELWQFKQKLAFCLKMCIPKKRLPSSN